MLARMDFVLYSDIFLQGMLSLVAATAVRVDYSVKLFRTIFILIRTNFSDSVARSQLVWRQCSPPTKLFPSKTPPSNPATSLGIRLNCGDSEVPSPSCWLGCT